MASISVGWSEEPKSERAVERVCARSRTPSAPSRPSCSKARAPRRRKTCARTTRRFVAIRREYQALLAENPGFVPARPVARNPVMRRPPEPAGKVWVSAEPAATLLDLGNAAYALMLRALGALFSPLSTDDDTRFALSELTALSMRLIGPLAERLTTLPASDEAPGVTAGPHLHDVAIDPRPARRACAPRHRRGRARHRAREAYQAALPKYVVDEFQKFLTCGDFPMIGG